MRRNYIGLSTSGHDGAVAIVDQDGVVRFAESTERWIQNKRALNIPPDLPFRTAELIAEYCDSDAEIVLAFSWSESPGKTSEAPFATAHGAALSPCESAQSLRMVMERTRATADYLAFCVQHAVSWQGRTLEYELRRLRGWRSGVVRRRFFDHHLTHAAAACFSSGFDSAACAVLDGYGEQTAAASFNYQQGELRHIPAESAPARPVGSLGVFYMDLCEACGFNAIGGEEWKMMGLAAYGRFDPDIAAMLRALVTVNGLALEAPASGAAMLLGAKLQRIARRHG